MGPQKEHCGKNSAHAQELEHMAAILNFVLLYENKQKRILDTLKRILESSELNKTFSNNYRLKGPEFKF